MTLYRSGKRLKPLVSIHHSPWVKNAKNTFFSFKQNVEVGSISLATSQEMYCSSFMKSVAS